VPITSAVCCAPWNFGGTRKSTKRAEIGVAQLRDIEDRCIRDAVKMQENIGMHGITDGEFRRNLGTRTF
jgi:methionine synthase II (cobalamin-independent)